MASYSPGHNPWQTAVIGPAGQAVPPVISSSSSSISRNTRTSAGTPSPPPVLPPAVFAHSHSSSFEADDERSAAQSALSIASDAQDGDDEAAARSHFPEIFDPDDFTGFSDTSSGLSDFDPRLLVAQHRRHHPHHQNQQLHRQHRNQDRGQHRHLHRDHYGRHWPPPTMAGALNEYAAVEAPRRRTEARHSRRSLDAHALAHASYAGEDTRPTSPKEILGWYMYAFASETYVICAIASFVPILLESLARENGVLLSDRTTPCSASNSAVSALSTSATSISERLVKGGDTQCVVYILGLEVNTASFAMYTFSVSVLLQALLVVSISCAADHGNYRKTLLIAFAWTGSFAVMLYLVVSARVYLLGAVLAIVSNTSFGASFVLLNSFLPLLIRHHPRVLFGEGGDEGERETEGEAEEEDGLARSMDRLGNRHYSTGDVDDDYDDSAAEAGDSTTALLHTSTSISPSSPLSSPPLLSRERTHEEQTSVELSLSTQISSTGIGIGYCAALFVQCVSIFIVFRMHNSTWSQRVVLFVIGAWWGVFTIPAAMWLRPRPGPPLPSSAFGKRQSRRTASGRRGCSGGAGRAGGAFGAAVDRARSLMAYVVYAWASLFRTIALARRLVDIVLFLAGWFLLSDAIATTSSTAVLFAKTQLRMEVWALGLINVISTSTGVVGAFSWAYVSRRLKLKPIHTILACLTLFELIPLYGLIGYLPAVQRWGVGGLQQPWEMYPLAAVYGLVLGGLGGYCRSLYGELIPPGSEAAFYALYAITDKGSSVFGPAIVGAIIDASGEIRPAFWFLGLLVGLPIPLLYFVDVERGKREGERLAAVIEGFQAQGGMGEDEDDDGDEDTNSSHTPRPILAAYDEDEEEE